VTDLHDRKWPQAALGSGHDITPVKGSARQLDGTPADLTRPMSYPCEALSLECGQPIQCERWFLGPWRHLERFSDPR
jgi:hypothetical protein